MQFTRELPKTLCSNSHAYASLNTETNAIWMRFNDAEGIAIAHFPYEAIDRIDYKSILRYFLTSYVITLHELQNGDKPIRNMVYLHYPPYSLQTNLFYIRNCKLLLLAS